MIPPALCTRRLAGHPALDCVEQGDVTGIPVIALHGVPDSWRSFQPLLPHLSPTLRLFALSQRGHGDSERPARVWCTRFDGFMTEDLRGELGRIDAPVLVVRGGRDVICAEADQLQMAAAVRGAEVKIYDDAGHAMHWEEPQRFARDLGASTIRAAAQGAPQPETAAA